MRGGDLRAAADVAGTVRRTYDGGAADRWHSALTRQPGTTGRAEPEEKSRILPGKFSGRSRLCLRGSSAEDPRTRPRHHRRTHLSSRGRAPADGFPRTPTKLSRCAKPAIRPWLPAAHDGWVPQPLRRPGARHRPGAFTRRTGPRLSCSGPSPGSGWREHFYGGFGGGQPHFHPHKACLGAGLKSAREPFRTVRQVAVPGTGRAPGAYLGRTSHHSPRSCRQRGGGTPWFGLSSCSRRGG